MEARDKETQNAYEGINIPQGLGDNVYAYDKPRSDAIANIIAQVNPALIIEELIHSLRGEVFNETKNTWEKVYPALMNQKGIQRFSNLVRSFINSNTTLSNLEEKDIIKQTWFFGRTVINLITIRYKDFEIDRGDFDLIKSMVINMAYFALRRACDEGERGFIQPIIRTTENVQIQQQPQGKGSFWDRFKV